ncbi:uncharacterized protein LOC108737404 [Agrilus planipennis]|uniref:Uncharacterized protein LOC108737404 n=1 Tax=Agrilus planipennis TaxID=224129 RepID=A0A1W4X093_AGRPL|nr:uncharacterized protein LOC108737404 [Agrilus planipennis]
MTMDVNKRTNGIKSEVIEAEEKIVTTKPVKRPFDVAFLMLPDERLKHKYNNKIDTTQANSQCENNNEKTNCDAVENFTTSKSDSISISPIDLHKLQGQKLFQTIPSKQQVFDDPALFKVKPATEADIYKPKLVLDSEQKSAFTKVNLLNKDRRVSPSLSVSPDINYQQSLSPSPPNLSSRNIQSFQSPVMSPTQVFRTQNMPPYQTHLVQDSFAATHSGADMEHHFIPKNHAADLLHPTFSKMRPMLGQYRPDISYSYPQFPAQDVLKIGNPELKFPPDIRNPAAAILTTLLPPSLAALSLPAQNVCAKCNVSFRMTSDLVYHMRSHHKNDAVDVTRRKREEKLKCPVCTASFRERHHLTRHMTAHQDKDEDDDEPPEAKKKSHSK